MRSDLMIPRVVLSFRVGASVRLPDSQQCHIVDIPSGEFPCVGIHDMIAPSKIYDWPAVRPATDVIRDEPPGVIHELGFRVGMFPHRVPGEAVVGDFHCGFDKIGLIRIQPTSELEQDVVIFAAIQWSARQVMGLPVKQAVIAVEIDAIHIVARIS